MRSHSLRAFALLCATSTLLACGESVEVGDFEDGTGGSGGGDLTTSGSTGNGSSTSSTTSSGTPSTSSSGGATSCGELGGQCLSDPGDPGFPALCEAMGMVPLDGTCAGINEGCCGATPTCDADAECSPDKLCDPCAHGSCPECDDCVSACVPHGCDPGPEPACAMARPDCGDGRTAVVRDGCYVCVELATCEPPAPPTPCDADAECAPTELCDPCATSSCPECDDCVAGCVAHACDPGGEPACDMIRPDCGDGRTAVVRDGCYVCVELSTCEPLRPCGGLGENGEIVCDDDEYCDWPDDICGADDGTGVCRPRPTSCDADGPVVCACSGENFPSACEAALQGFDVWGGEDLCPAPQACGGFGGAACDDGFFCDFPNDLCGGDDGQGVCRPRPGSCPEPEPGEEVCGCDFGPTYDSACEANRAGHDVSSGEPLECGGA